MIDPSAAAKLMELQGFLARQARAIYEEAGALENAVQAFSPPADDTLAIAEFKVRALTSIRAIRAAVQRITPL